MSQTQERRVWLVRHADAVSPSTWPGPETERPLTARGEAQADAIARRLEPESPLKLISSPYLRCCRTLEPLARVLGHPVEPDPRLREGGDAVHVLEWLRALAPAPVVACSHGDLIPDLLGLLARAGATLDGQACAMGSIWEIREDAQGRVIGRYAAPAWK